MIPSYFQLFGELRESQRISEWWPETGSNRRRRPFQGRALPLSYLALALLFQPGGQVRPSVSFRKLPAWCGEEIGRALNLRTIATSMPSIATRRRTRQTFAAHHLKQYYPEVSFIRRIKQP